MLLDLTSNLLLAVFSVSATLFLVILAGFRLWQKSARYRAKNGRGWEWYNTEWTDRWDKVAEPILYAKPLPLPVALLWSTGLSLAAWLIIRAVVSFG